MTEMVGPYAPRVSPLGCGALLFESIEPFGQTAQRRVWHVASQARDWKGIRETVPGMNNLMVVFDPAVVGTEAVIRDVLVAWQQEPPAVETGKLVEIPVVYGGPGGLDLAVVADHAGLDADAVVRLHSQATYTVYFLGAHPGFAYLGGLPEQLHTPRRAEPRLQVQQGTVAIGGMQTGVVAQTSPSGWQLIGTTDERFFDPAAQPPALLAPGDRVRFVPVGIER